MLEVIILAAGKGTRMKSDMPKVLHTLAGKPFLFHVLEKAFSLNAEKIHLVVGHGASLVSEAVNQCDAFDTSKINFIEQQEQLGTGHAVQQVMPYLSSGSRALILYGDVPLIGLHTLTNLVSNIDLKNMALLTVNFDDPTGYGRIIRNDSGFITNIVEQKDASEEQLNVREVNSGIMAVASDLLLEWLPTLSSNNAQGEYYLTDIIGIAAESGIQVNPFHPKDANEVLGVNDRKQQAQLERIYQSLQADKLMQNGATLLDPNRFDCRGTLLVGNDCIIDVNCIFEGDVTLGHNVVIGPNCTIINSTLADNIEIKANSIVENSRIEQGCVVGPFARLRPGTELKGHAKIGNFVETKMAKVGLGSKVNHLSYVGDAIVGNNVNIGAGTITCNYDGANKSLTELGDGVFVGSNTALVAPVKVDENATIGAGSVITTNVEPNQLALSRAKQQTIKGWKRPTKKKS